MHTTQSQILRRQFFQSLSAATCAAINARSGVIDAGRALTANKLCAIAREAAFAFAVFFISLLALLNFGFWYVRRMFG